MHRTLPTPIGNLTVVVSARGVSHVAFAGEHIAGTGQDGDEHILEQACTQLAEYFSGYRRQFDLPLDHAGTGGFQTQVQTFLASIGYGETVSYRDIAHALGRPGAVRAVGTGCATNPLPILLPCHRVLRSDGSLGGYRGGLSAKQWLLEHER